MYIIKYTNLIYDTYFLYYRISCKLENDTSKKLLRVCFRWATRIRAFIFSTIYMRHTRKTSYTTYHRNFRATWVNYIRMITLLWSISRRGIAWTRIVVQRKRTRFNFAGSRDTRYIQIYRKLARKKYRSSLAVRSHIPTYTRKRSIADVI